MAKRRKKHRPRAEAQTRPATGTRSQSGAEPLRGQTRGQELDASSESTTATRGPVGTSSRPNEMRRNSGTLVRQSGAEGRNHPILAWAGTVGAVVAAVAGIVAFFLPDISWSNKAFVTVLAALVASLVHGRGARKLTHLAAVSLVIAGWMAVLVLTRPSTEEAAVDALMAQTEASNIWVGRDPVMFPRSRDFILDNFTAFDYSAWHAWDELAKTEVVRLSDLVVQAAGYSGQGVVTLGQVNVAQPLGGLEWLVQVKPLDQQVANLEATQKSVRNLVGERDAAHVLSDAMSDPHGSSLTVYCLVTLAPFVHLQPGETILLNGVNIAYGQTQRIDGRLSHVAYMLGSSIVRFYDAPPDEAT